MLAFDQEVRAAIPQTCVLCRDQKAPEEAKARRKRWGCDEELTLDEWRENEGRSDNSALSFQPCFRCAGKDPECEVCDGSNEWRLHRCPHAAVDQWHFDVCSSVALQREGITATGGGWMDQPALGVRAGRIVAAELSRIEAAERERQTNQNKRGAK